MGAIRQIVIAIGRVEPMTEVTVANKIPGGIKAELVKEGDLVKIGQPIIRFDEAELTARVSVPLMVLGDVAKVIVKAEVDETDVGKLALGQAAGVTADAYPGRVFPGKIIEIGQSVGKRKVKPEDPAKIQDMKGLEMKIEVTEGGADLKVGMTVDVRILTLYKERAVVIPKRLVPPGATEAMLRVAGSGPPEPRLVKLGLRDDARVEVLAGLREGEQVVVPAAPSR